MGSSEANPDLVYIDDYGLLGSNFYWDKRDTKGVTLEEIMATGLRDNRVQVHRDLITPLQEIDRELKANSYRLYIKEGYRSKALYELVYRKRVEMFGKEETDRLLNMNDMPHSTGKSVDVSLRDIEGKEEIFMRNGSDGTDALFYGYYKDKTDQQSQNLQALQDKVKELMERKGFKFGTKNEYFHFDYKG